MIDLRQKVLSRVLKIAYHLLYHQFAWAYDAVADIVSLGSWREWVRCILPFVDGERVLELGYGPGHLQRWLTEGGVATFGVDASPQMARRAKKQASNLSLADAQKLPYPKACFDQVVATFPSNTILSKQALSESRRVLVPGGTLIMLPLAWTHGMRGKNIFQKSTVGLWQTRAQVASWDERYLKRFSEAGFQTRAEQIRTTSWSLVIILAQKAAQSVHWENL
jgi:ubiquinone/menaquinone biosynthesis C-methylase UbiE